MGVTRRPRARNPRRPTPARAGAARRPFARALRGAANVVLISAAGDREHAYEDEVEVNGAAEYRGVLTRALLEGLSGAADQDGNRSISGAELKTFFDGKFQGSFVLQPQHPTVQAFPAENMREPIIPTALAAAATPAPASRSATTTGPAALNPGPKEEGAQGKYITLTPPIQIIDAATSQPLETVPRTREVVLGVNVNLQPIPDGKITDVAI